MALRVFHQAASKCLRQSAARSRSGYRARNNDLSPAPLDSRNMKKRHHSFESVHNSETHKAYNRIELTVPRKSASDMVVRSKNHSSILKPTMRETEITTEKVEEKSEPKLEAKKKEIKVTFRKNKAPVQETFFDKTGEKEKLYEKDTKHLIHKMKTNKGSTFQTPPKLSNFKGSQRELDKCNDLIESFKSLNPNIPLSSSKDIKINVPWYSYSDMVCVNPNKTQSNSQTGTSPRKRVVDARKVNVENVMREWHSGNHPRIDELLLEHGGKSKQEEIETEKEINEFKKEKSPSQKRIVYNLTTTCRNYKPSLINSMYKSRPLPSSDVPVQAFSTEFRPSTFPELKRPVKKYDTNVDQPRKDADKQRVVWNKRADDDKNVHVIKPLPNLKFGSYKNSEMGVFSDYNRNRQTSMKKHV